MDTSKINRRKGWHRAEGAGAAQCRDERERTNAEGISGNEGGKSVGREGEDRMDNAQHWGSENKRRTKKEIGWKVVRKLTEERKQERHNEIMRLCKEEKTGTTQITN